MGAGVWQLGSWAGPGCQLPADQCLSFDTCGEELDINFWHRSAKPWKESTGKTNFSKFRGVKRRFREAIKKTNML